MPAIKDGFKNFAYWLDQRIFFKICAIAFPLAIALFSANRALGLDTSAKLARGVERICKAIGIQVETEVIDEKLNLVFYVFLACMALLIFFHKTCSVAFTRLDPESEPNDIDELMCFEHINSEIVGHIRDMCTNGFAPSQFSTHYNLQGHVEFVCRVVVASLKRTYDLRENNLYTCLYVADNLQGKGMRPSSKYVSSGHYPTKHGLPSLGEVNLEKPGDFPAFDEALADQRFVFTTNEDLRKIKIARKDRKTSKKIRHALTIPIRIEEEIWGFFRIEIFDKKPFADEQGVERFMLESFRISERILCYLLLKRKAFENFKRHYKKIPAD